MLSITRRDPCSRSASPLPVALLQTFNTVLLHYLSGQPFPSLSAMDVAVVKVLLLQLSMLLGALSACSQVLMSRQKWFMERLRRNIAVLQSLQMLYPVNHRNQTDPHTSRSRSLLRAHLAIRPRQRRWSVRPKAMSTWWEDTVLATWDDGMWLYHFRMTRATVFEIADHLRPHLTKSETAMRKAIPVEKRVALTIWWLSSPLLYRKTANSFGVGISTAAGIVLEVCKAMKDVLLPAVVCLGNHREVMAGFRALGFPQCIGAVDGTYIQIRAPAGRGEQFTNKKSLCSIQVQGTVDHTGRFIDVEVGFSGKQHDANVFRNSALYQAMEAGAFVPGNPTTTIQGVQVGPLIIADATYPLNKWLMKPYSGGNLDPEKLLFNQHLRKARCVVERAFGRLKSRWRCLTSPLTVSEDHHTQIILACIVLHNICESKGHSLHPSLASFPAPPVTILPPEQLQDRQRRREGEIVRSAIASYFMVGQ